MRAGLETALRDAVRTGRLRAGARLPSSRALAADLGIARNTVAEAYGQLVAEGWLTAAQGSGTRVADRAAPAAATARGDAPRTAAAAALRPAARARPTSPRSRAPPGWPPARARAATPRPTTALGYARPARPAASCAPRWPATSPGPAACASTPDRIVVCAGFTQGLGLLCQVLRARGARDRRGRGVRASRHTADRRGAAGLRLPRARRSTSDGADAASARRRRRPCC